MHVTLQCALQINTDSKTFTQGNTFRCSYFLPVCFFFLFCNHSSCVSFALFYFVCSSISGVFIYAQPSLETIMCRLLYNVFCPCVHTPFKSHLYSVPSSKFCTVLLYSLQTKNQQLTKMSFSKLVGGIYLYICQQ